MNRATLMLRGLGLTALLLTLGGCTTTRIFTILSRPPGATIKIDGIERGRTPLEESLVFANSTETHTIVASRVGFADLSRTLGRDDSTTVNFELKPATRLVRINVEPLEAIIRIDGKPVSPMPVKSWSKEMEFTVDAQGRWTSYRITVERLGYQTQEKTLTGEDKNMVLAFMLAPMRKTVTITSTPQDAHVYLDGKNIGKTPLTQTDMPFTTDPQTNQWSFHKLRLAKPGYLDAEQQLSWDDGKTDYIIDLKPITKTVKILPKPAGATVTIDGTPYKADKDGNVVAELPFVPDANGDPKKYAVQVTYRTEGSEWEPTVFTIAYDDGNADYPVALKEIRTTWVDLLTAGYERKGDNWQIVPRTIKTLARKDVTEGVSRTQPQKLTALPEGTMIDSLAISRDGLLVFTVLQAPSKTELRSVMKTINTAEGAVGVKDIGDGLSLDLHPSFTPNGKEIVYSSDRGGRQHIWKLSASGEGGFTPLSSGETTDLWPSIDPTGKVYYQALVEKRSDPRVYMVELGKNGSTDLPRSGTQPRVSPDNTSLLICEANEKTLKRDIFTCRVDRADGPALPTNLTKAPDTDNFDAAWSPDGRKIAFVSDRGLDEDKRHNYDIWILDLAKPDAPIQLTTNGSWDDCPVWSPKGDAIYFRSNRGGRWGIWKLALPAELVGAKP